MKELVIVSGKGGVGKTTVSASLAYLLGGREVPLAVADADVDTPSLHLVLGMEPISTEESFLSRKAEIHEDKCTGCGKCISTCPYGALEQGPGGKPVLSWFACEGCGACKLVCPAEAISIKSVKTGELVVGRTRYGQPMVTAQLELGEHNSGLLVSQVRIRAHEAAISDGAELVLVDGAPGIGCPVISSLVGADAALVVVEPTPESLKGALRVLDVIRHFRLEAASVLNKADISDFGPRAEEELEGAGAPVIAEIPYDRAVVDALAQERPVAELYPGSKAGKALLELSRAVKELFLA